MFEMRVTLKIQGDFYPAACKIPESHGLLNIPN